MTKTVIKEPELEEGDLAVIQHAVSLARERQIRSVELLRDTLERHKYSKREIDNAIGFWAHYEQTKPGAGKN